MKQDFMEHDYHTLRSFDLNLIMDECFGLKVSKKIQVVLMLQY